MNNKTISQRTPPLLRFPIGAKNYMPTQRHKNPIVILLQEKN